MPKFILLFFLAVFLLDCRKDLLPTTTTTAPAINNLPAANGLAVSVSLDATRTGNVIPATFQGLSYETGILAESPEILNENNKVLVQLIKNLGPGLLRIGGDSSDETFWTGAARTATTGTDSITTSDIDRLSAFSKAIGWPVLFGLNMGDYQPDVAANESAYVATSLQSNLYSLDLGNEPDVYQLYGLRSKSYSLSDYVNDWDAYRSSILKTVPKATFSGPGTAYQFSWITNFANNEHGQINLLEAHYYDTGPASSSSIGYNTILYPDGKLNNFLSVMSGSSLLYHLPFRITECNNVYGGGKAGTSDVFASALWALDFMWNVAESNGQGINFHGGNGLFYSPIAIANGVITARPEYYAMMAFKYGTANGTIIYSQIDQSGYNLSAYACINADKTYSITLINKDLANNFAFTIKPGQTVTRVGIMRLSAPSVTSTTGTTFGSSSVSADGTFKATTEDYKVNNKTFVVNVPATSAAVITLKF